MGMKSEEDSHKDCPIYKLASKLKIAHTTGQISLSPPDQSMLVALKTVFCALAQAQPEMIPMLIGSVGTTEYMILAMRFSELLATGAIACANEAVQRETDKAAQNKLAALPPIGTA